MDGLVSVQTKLRFLRSVAGEMNESDFDLLQAIETEEDTDSIEILYKRYRSETEANPED